MARFDTVPIRSFSRASGTIFRGAVPDREGIRFMADLGIKSVIDLRPASAKTQNEGALASEYGLTYFNIPFNVWGLPDSAAAAFLAVSMHPIYQPVYVHCNDQIRTTAMVGLFRVAVEGWSFDWADSEMRANGLKPWHFLLRRSVAKFARRLNPLTVQQRLWALQEFVSSNIFSV